MCVVEVFYSHKVNILIDKDINKFQKFKNSADV